MTIAIIENFDNNVKYGYNTTRNKSLWESVWYMPKVYYDNKHINIFLYNNVINRTTYGDKDFRKI